jgi:hypothetical protein
MSKCYNKECDFYSVDYVGNCEIKGRMCVSSIFEYCKYYNPEPPQKKRLMTVEEFEKAGACWIKNNKGCFWLITEFCNDLIFNNDFIYAGNAPFYIDTMQKNGYQWSDYKRQEWYDNFYIEE